MLPLLLEEEEPDRPLDEADEPPLWLPLLPEPDALPELCCALVLPDWD